MMRLFLSVGDEFELLSTGKLAGFGLYGDRVVVCEVPDAFTPTAEAPVALDKLTFVATIAGMPTGTHQFAFAIIDPDGLVVPYELPTQQFALTEGQSQNFIMRFTPFVVPKFGVYQLEMVANGQVDEALRVDFECRRKIQPAPRVGSLANS